MSENVLYDALFRPHIENPAPFLYLKGGGTVSYREFLETTNRIASLLRESGLRPGYRVAAQVSKSAQALALYAACVQSGMVFLPLNTAYTPAEIKYFVEDAGAALLVCDPGKEPQLAEIAGSAGARLMTLGGDGGGTLMEQAGKQVDDRIITPRTGDDLAALLYTSGTTGRSKGAMLSGDNLLSNARALHEYWQFSRDDVLLHALPIFHTHGLFVATNVALLAGSAMIFLPGFNTDDVIEYLPQATAMMGVPTFYTRLLSDERFTEGRVDHMRVFISGSAPMLVETHGEFEARTGHRVLERYGMTETNMNTSNPYDGERRVGTVGKPLPGVSIRVCSQESGEEAGEGEIGVVEIMGPNVFSGYWNMPEKTKAEFREDGWFISGDLGFIDAEGYLTIVGREKDMIISGGYNVYPKEIELVMDSLDGVVESAVFGVPHPDFGEAVVAAVVVEDGAVTDENGMIASTRKQIASYKTPKRVFITSDLPRNTMGKVMKNILRQQHRGLFS